MIGDLFGLSAQLGLYQGVPALGGGLQFLFMLTSNEGGAESAAGRERGGRSRRAQSRNTSASTPSGP
jgi:hypothetical protein